MLKLKDLQQQFIHHALKKDTSAVLCHLAPHANFSAAELMDIYASSIQTRFNRVLERIYPRCLQLLGPLQFAHFAQHYLQVLSTYPVDLNQIGSDFSRSLLGLSYPLDYLTYLAGFEWRWHTLKVPFSPESIFDYAALNNVSETMLGGLRFILSASLSLHACPVDIISIWVSKSTTPAAQSTPKYYALHQSEAKPQYLVLTKLEFQLLTAIHARLSFKKLSKQFPTLDTLMTRLITQNIIVGFTTSI